jgi:YD repeat-containing protein
MTPMPSIEPTRRDFLVAAASVAGIRSAATLVPLIAQLIPDSSAIAAGAVVAGDGLGLLNTSLKILGPSGVLGQSALGQGSSSAFINAVNGNLVLQMQDAQLAGRGLDLYALRTYNSLSIPNDGDGDGWRWAYEQTVKFQGLGTPAQPQPGDTVIRTAGDGHETMHVWNAARAAYISTEGGGPRDELRYDAPGEWVWTDGATRVVERYSYAPASNVAGRLISRTDTSGNSIVLMYDGGRLTVIQDSASQQELRLIYGLFYGFTRPQRLETRALIDDASGHATATLSGALRQVEYGYDNLGRLTTVTADLTPADGSIADGVVFVTTYTYDDTTARVASVTQSDGTRVFFTYDAGRIGAVKDQSGATSAQLVFTYSPETNSTAITDGNGQVWTYRYDGTSRQLTEILSPMVGSANLSTKFKYENGNLVSITDPRNNTVIYEYDSNGNRTLERDAIGNTVTRTFSADNQMLTETRYRVADPDGAGPQSASDPLTTRYVYDSSARLRFVVSPEGRVIENRYGTGYGLLINRLQYVGQIYDLTGLSSIAQLTEAQLTAWVVALQDKTQIQFTEYSYDLRGNMSQQTSYASVNAGGNGILDNQAGVTEYIYDAQSHLGQQIAVRGTARDQRALITNFTYDGIGRVLSATGATGPQTTVYDDANGRVAVTTANGLIETRSYDSRGRLTSVSQAGDATTRQTRYLYDNADQLRMAEDAQGRRRYRFYDAAGRLAYSVDATGAVTGFEYNGTGQIARRTRYQNRADTSNWYDSTTLKVTKESLTAGGASSDVPIDPIHDRVTIFDYDAAGRLTTSTDAVGTVTSTSYDGLSRVIMTQTGDRATRHLYDRDNRKVGVVDPLGYLTEYKYDAGGRLVETARYGQRSQAAANMAAPVWIGVTNQNAIGGEPFEYRMPAYDADGDHLTLTVVGTPPSWLSFDAGAATLRGTPPAAVANYSVTLRGDDGRGKTADVTVLIGVTNAAPTGAGGGGPAWVSLSPLDVVTNTPVNYVVPPATGQSLIYSLVGGMPPGLSFDPVTLTVTGTSTAVGFYTIALRATNGSGDSVDRTVSVQIRTAAATAAQPTGGDQLSSWRPSDTSALSSYLYYDGQGRVVGSVDEQQFLTETVYDDALNTKKTLRYPTPVTVSPSDTMASLKSRAGASYQTSLSQYDGLGRVLESTELDGSTLTRNEYDQAGRLIRTVIAANTSEERARRTFYNAFGEVIATFGGEGDAWLGTNPQRITEAISDYGIRHEYDTLGRKIRSVDANGNKALFYYDRENRLTHTVSVIGQSADNTLAGEVSETTYNSFGETATVRRYATRLAAADMAQLMDGGGGGFADESLLSKLAALANTSLDQVSSYEYDRSGRLVKQVDGENGVTVNFYNAFGELAARVRSTREGQSATKQLDYDLNGRVVSTTDDVGGINSNSRTTYDAFGRVTQSIDGRGKFTTTAYQNNGRTVVVTDPLNRTTRTEYDTLGRVLRVTNALNQRTTYAYNDVTRTVTVTTPQGLRVTTARTRHGEIASVTDGQGHIIRYAYNKDGQLTTKTDALGRLTATTYDQSGRKLQFADARGVLTQFKYDQRNQIVEQRLDPNGLNLRTQFAFDALGQQIKVTEAANTPAARVTIYAYDRNGRKNAETVDAAQDGLQLLTQYSYDDLGDITRIARGTVSKPNQHVKLHEFDTLRRHVKEIAAPSSVFGAGAPGTRDLTTQYRYDAGGRVSRRIDANRQSTWYVYDAAGQLTHTISALGEVSESKYDAAGRMVYSRRYFNRLSASTVVAFGDVVGTFAAPATDANDQANYVVYDNDGRGRFKLNATGSSGWVISENRYDANGNVIEARSYDKFLPNSRIAAIDSVNSSGITLSEIQGELTTTLNYSDTTPSTLAGVQRTRFAYDANNRLRFTVDASGSVTEGVYDAVGNVVSTIRFADRPTLTNYTESAINLAVNRSDVHNQITRQAYDAADRLRYTVNALGSVSEKAYDARSNLVKTTRWASRPTLTQYTESAITAALAAMQSTADDQVTRFVYDTGNRLRFTIDALGSVNENRYDGVGNVLVTTRFARRPTGLASFTESEVDAAVYSLRGDLSNQVIHFAYDANKRLRFTIDALGSVGESVYDGMGHVTLTRRFAERPMLAQYTESAIDATVSPLRTIANNQVTRFAHDAEGRLRFTVDALGSVSETVYDAFGQVSDLIRYAVRPPLTEYTETAIDAAVATQRNDSNNHLQHNIYGAAGQLRFSLNRVSVDGGQSSYQVIGQELNALGQKVANISCANPIALTGLSEAAIELAVGGGTPAKNRVSRFVYDLADRQLYSLEAVTVEAGQRWYRIAAQQFDTFGRVVGSTKYAATVALNAFDRAAVDVAVNAIADGTKDRAAFAAYDVLDQVAYQVKVLSHGLHQVLKLEYDALGRMIKKTQYASAVGALANFELATIEAAVNAIAAADDRKVQYVYDAAGRQRFVLQTDSDARWTIGESRYDILGNRVESRRYDRYVTDAWIESVDHTNSLGINEQEMLGQLSSLGYSDGTPATLVNVQLTRFVYDTQSQLRFTIDALGSVAENRYDAFGRIVTNVRFAARPTLADYTERAIAVAVDPNDANNQVQHLAYDAAGRLRFNVQVIEPNVGPGGKHLVKEQRYDAFGRMVESCAHSTALGHLNAYEENTIAGAITPDVMNDRRSFIAYDVGAACDCAAPSRQAYTLRELRTLREPPTGYINEYVVTKHVYDALSQLIQRTEYASPVALTQFDKASIDAAVVADLSNDRTTTYVHDAAGRLRFEISPDLSFRESMYDGLDQVREARQFNFNLSGNVPQTEEGMIALRGNRAVGDGVTRGKVYTYDAAGRVVSTSDALNNIERSEYSALSDQTRWLDKNGYSWGYEYNRRGQKTKETTPPMQFKLAGEVLDSPAPDRVLDTRFAYDAFGNLIQKVEAANFPNDARTTDFIFDTVGRLTKTLFPGYYDAGTGRVEGGPGGPSANRFRQEASATYDPLGNVVRTGVRTGVNGLANTTGDGLQHTYRTYNSQGQVVHEINPLNNVTQYTYTSFGEPETVTRYSITISGVPANGLYWTAGEVDPQLNLGHNENGHVISDYLARTITMAYDRLGRKSSVTQPSATFYSTHKPNDASQGNYYRANEDSVTAVQDAPVTRYEYNSFDDVTLQRVRINNIIEWQDTSFTNDAMGRTTRSVDAAGFVTDMLYDAVGNLVRKEEHTGKSDGTDRVTGFVYNALNQQTRVDRYGLRYTDANGVDHGLLHWDHILHRWLDPEADVATTVKTTAYDGYGRTLSVTDGVGNVTSMRYYALGQLAQTTDPARSVAPIPANGESAVDPFRNQVTETPVTSITLDAFGRPVRQARATSQSADTRETLQSYDTGGNLVSSTDAEGNVKLRYYDYAGRVTKETQAINVDLGALGINTQGLERRYTYDSLGHLTDTLDVYLDGTDLMQSGQSAVYNAFGEVVEQQRKWGLASQSLAALKVAIVARYDYDNAGHVFEKVAGDGATDHGLTLYYYNLQGQVTREERRGSTAGVEKRVTETQYDVLGRVIMVRRPAFNADMSNGPGRDTRLVTPYASRSVDRWGNLVSYEEGGYQSVNGQPVYAPNPLSRSYQYDDNNKPVTEFLGTQAIVTSSGESTNSQISKYFFRDLLGNVVKEVDEAVRIEAETDTQITTRRLRRKEYNTVGQLIANIDGSNRKIEYAYSIHGDRLGTRNARGTVLFDRYDRNGNIRFHGVLRTASLAGAGEYNSFDGTGTIDRTYLKAYLYDQADRRFASKTFTEGANAPWSYTWLDGRNFGISQRDEVGVVTQYRYDQFGNKSVEIDGAGVRKEWNAATADYIVGRIETYSQPHVYFTGGGTIIGEEKGSYTYNSFGELYLDRKIEGSSARTEYEQFNGLVFSTTLTDSSAPNAREVTQYSYDARGQLVSESRLDSNSWQATFTSYDNQSRLTAVQYQNPAPNAPTCDVQYSYDEWGNVRSVKAIYQETDAEGPVTREGWYTYDEAGRILISNGAMSGGKIGLVDPMLRTTGFGPALQIEYDNVGRRSGTTEYFGAHSSPHPVPRSWDTNRDEIYEYDDLGHLRKTEQRVLYFNIIDANSGDRELDKGTNWQMLSSRSSNLRGDVTQAEEWSRLSAKPFEIQVDQAQHVSTTTSAYRADGQVSSTSTVADNPSDSTSIQNHYDPQTGQLSSYEFRGYRSDHTPYVATFSYTYSFQNGNRAVSGISEAHSDGPDNTTTLKTIKAYDDAGRLNRETIDLPNPNGGGSDRQEERRYKYAPSGRIIFKSTELSLTSAGPNTVPLKDPTTGQQLYVYAGDRTIATVGAQRLAEATKFDFAYTPMSEAGSYGTSRYVVQSGDTLIGIAQSVYGDSALWYIIADANSIVAASDKPLDASEVGKAYEIPSVIRSSNSASTFSPYNAAEIIGNERPIVILPPAPLAPTLTGDLKLMALYGVSITVQVGVTVGLSALGVPAPLSAAVAAGLSNLAGQETAWELGMRAPGQKNGIDWSKVEIAAAEGYAFSSAGSLGGLSREVWQQIKTGFSGPSGWTSGSGPNWSGIGGSLFNVGLDALGRVLTPDLGPDVRQSRVDQSVNVFGNAYLLGWMNAAYNPSSGWAIAGSGKSPAVGAFEYAYGVLANIAGNMAYEWIREQLERPSAPERRPRSVNSVDYVFRGAGSSDIDRSIPIRDEYTPNDPLPVCFLGHCFLRDDQGVYQDAGEIIEVEGQRPDPPVYKQSLLDDITAVVAARYLHNRIPDARAYPNSPSIVHMFEVLGLQSLSGYHSQNEWMNISDLRAFDLGVEVFAKRFHKEAEFADAARRGSYKRESQDASAVYQYDDYYLVDKGYTSVVNPFVGSKQQHKDFEDTLIANHEYLFKVESDLVATMGGEVDANSGGKSPGVESPGVEYQWGAALKPPVIEGSAEPASTSGGAGGGSSPGGGGIVGGAPTPFISLTSGYEAMSGTRNGIIVDPVRFAAYQNLAVGKWGGAVNSLETESAMLVATSTARNRALAAPMVRLASLGLRNPPPWYLCCGEIGSLNLAAPAPEGLGIDTRGGFSQAYNIVNPAKFLMDPHTGALDPDTGVQHLSPKLTCPGCRWVLPQAGVSFPSDNAGKSDDSSTEQ